MRKETKYGRSYLGSLCHQHERPPHPEHNLAQRQRKIAALHTLISSCLHTERSELVACKSTYDVDDERISRTIRANSAAFVVHGRNLFVCCATRNVLRTENRRRTAGRGLWFAYDNRCRLPTDRKKSKPPRPRTICANTAPCTT